MALHETAVRSGSMPAETSRTIQITIRVPKDWPGRAERLAPLLSRPGMEVRPTDALRAALARGFEILERELGAAPPVAPATGNGAKPKAKATKRTTKG